MRLRVDTAAFSIRLSATDEAEIASSIYINVKTVRYSSSLTDFTATGRHLPYGISHSVTSTYLPSDRSERAPP